MVVAAAPVLHMSHACAQAFSGAADYGYNGAEEGPDDDSDLVAVGMALLQHDTSCIYMTQAAST